MFVEPVGATPINDSSGLKLAWVRTRNQLNEAEADNILKAVSAHFNKRKPPQQWFQETYLRKLHAQMFGSVWDWAGCYYKGPLRNIGITWQQIPIQLRELCQDVLFWLENPCDLTFLEQSVRIHFRLAQIHPFPNGNGRHARFVADLYLHSLHGKRPLWPEQILSSGTNLRSEYIASLKEADVGNYSRLTHLTQKYGGRNPTESDVLSETFFKKYFSQPKRMNILEGINRFITTA
jgi:Fic-DOC domain mobile mystery protein B